MKPIYLKNLYDEEWLEMAFQLGHLSEQINKAVEHPTESTAQYLDAFIRDPKSKAVLIAARDFSINEKVRS